MARTQATGSALRRATAGAEESGEVWLKRLGRLGHAARGLVYLVIGVMAVRAAIDAGGHTAGTQGALEQIARQPLGEALLWVVALGLAGYALWRFIAAIRDTERHGTDAKGIVKRVGYAVSGVVHVGLAVAALGLARGSGSGGGDGASERGYAAELMAQPFGRWLVVLAGLIVVVVGLKQFRDAYQVRFRDKLRSDEMSVEETRWAIRSGRLGYAARGVTFVLAGAFLAYAGLQADPSEARGMAEVLQTLEQQPFGRWLLAIVGLGLACFGVFQFVLARYRRMVLR